MDRDDGPTLPGVVFKSRGGLCPYQADGTVDGVAFYFRGRDSLTLDIGGADPVWAGDWTADLSHWAFDRWDYDYYGYLTHEEALECMAHGFAAWRRSLIVPAP